MTSSSKFTIPPQVISRTVGEETVILELESGTYFGLDPVGARMWELMGEGRTFGQLCDIVMQEYEVSRERLEEDVTTLVQQLADRRLVTLSDS